MKVGYYKDIFDILQHVYHKFLFKYINDTLNLVQIRIYIPAINTFRKNPYPTRHAYEKIPWVSEYPVHGMQYPTVALVQWLQVGYMNALEINEKLR